MFYILNLIASACSETYTYETGKLQLVADLVITHVLPCYCPDWSFNDESGLLMTRVSCDDVNGTHYARLKRFITTVKKPPLTVWPTFN